MVRGEYTTEMLERHNFDDSKFHRPKAAFSRATEININGARWIFISGTASVDSDGNTVHTGDFEKQVRQTYNNIETLLSDAKATFKDIVSFTIYLKDIARHYEEFDKIRGEIFKEFDIYNSSPSSTCVEARLCRDELLVEISAIAVRGK